MAGNRGDYWSQHYQLLKSNGLCVHCKQDRDREGACCSKCTGSSTSKESRKKYRQTCLALGLCMICGSRPRKPDYKGRLTSRCVECAARHNAGWMRRYWASHPTRKRRKNRCSLCNSDTHTRKGHDEATRSQESQPPSIEEYATQRHDWRVC